MPNKRQTAVKPQLGLLDILRAAIQSDTRSLRQIAQLTGTTHGQLGRFIRGERTLGADALDRLAQVLGVVVKLPRQKRDKPRHGQGTA